MAIGPDALSVGRRKGQVACACTGGDDDILGGEFFHLAVFGHAQLTRRGQFAVAHMDGNLVLFHQMRDALIELLGYTARTLHNRIDIRADIRRRQAIITRMLHIMVDFRRPQQCLGGNASPIETNPAQIFTLDNRCLQTKLRGTDSGHIAAGAGTEDDKVVIAHRFTPDFERIPSLFDGPIRQLAPMASLPIP